MGVLGSCPFMLAIWIRLPWTSLTLSVRYKHSARNETTR